MGGGRLHVSKEKLEEKRKGADTPFCTRLYGASYPNQSKSRPYVLSILNENYNYFLLYLGFFRVHISPGSQIERSQISSSFQTYIIPALVLFSTLPDPFFDPRCQQEGSFEIGSVRLSGRFLGMYHSFFLLFGMMLETHVKLQVTEPEFSEKTFAAKIEKMGQKWAKNRVLNILKDFVINFY